MPSYHVECKIGKALHSKLLCFEAGSLERKVILVLQENQLRRVEALPCPERDDVQAKLCAFLAEPQIQDEVSHAREFLAQLNETGMKEEIRRAARLIRKFERVGRWHKKTGQRLPEMIIIVSGGALESDRSRH
jgi:hypothetical protein